MTTLTEAVGEARAYGELSARRDEIIRTAKQAGASVTQIAELMRLSRPTVYAVLGEAAESLQG